MKNHLALHIIAILIAVAIATGLFFWLKELEFQPTKNLLAIGEIVTIEGRLDHRLPSTTRTKVFPGPGKFHHQELLITQGAASSAEIYFPSAETVIRLHGNTRFIAERDPSRDNAIVATILDGTVTVLKAEKSDLITIYKSGRELKLEGHYPITLGLDSTPKVKPDTQEAQDTEFRIIVTATTKPADTTKPEEAASETQAEASSDILTNEDILRRLRSQSGFFQRCYLNHIHRVQSQTGELALGTPGSTGTIVTTFTIETNGKVSDAKIVRSDFKDTILHNCVTEVLERTTFRAFKGEPVPVREFPISFQ